MSDTGSSTVLGRFNGTIAGTITYQNTKGKWLIVRESWNYVTFIVQNAGGATTFPQWRTVGGPIEETKSPNAFKQFVWDYGGAGTAIFIFAFIFSLAVVVIMKQFRR